MLAVRMPSWKNPWSVPHWASTSPQELLESRGILKTTAWFNGLILMAISAVSLSGIAITQESPI